MNFAESTHKSSWIFTADNASHRRYFCQREIRGQLNAKSNDKVASSQPQAPASGCPSISVEEESKLLKFYQTRIQKITTHPDLKFPKKVQAAAIMYMKRFYLGTSCMDQDPSSILLTCIYLAGKIEESYIDAEQFCTKLKQDSGVVLRNELVLLAGLHFDLIVHTPYRAIAGFFQDIGSCRRDSPQELDEKLATASDSTLQKAHGYAVSSADALMLTDAPLLFPPGQVALAALRSGFNHVHLSIDRYLQRVVRKAETQVSQDEGAAFVALRTACEQIDRFGREGATSVTAQEVQDIDRRLKGMRSMAAGVQAEAQEGGDEDEPRAERREIKVKLRKQAKPAVASGS